MAKSRQSATAKPVRLSLAPSGTWQVEGNTTAVIKTGATLALMRVHNNGPTNQTGGGITVRDGKTVLVVIKPGTSCDVEGKEISVTGFNLSGWYDRL